MADYKKEMDFDIDSFGGQKYLKSAESIGSVLQNLLFMKPGSYPSMPHLGLNIPSILYSISEGIDVDEIKNKLQSQCTELLPYILLGEIKVFVKTVNNVDILMITIELETEPGEEERLLYGFAKNGLGDISSNFDIIKGEDLKR